MSAYAISEVEMRDAADFEAYRASPQKRSRSMAVAIWSAAALQI
jgi:hypothetical protein